MPETKEPGKTAHYFRSPLAIAAVYAAGSAAWIALSDFFLALLFPDHGNWLGLSILKGLGFVLATTALLFFLLKKFRRETERETGRYENALQKEKNSNERFRALFDGLVEPAFWADENRNILRANPAAKQLFAATEGISEDNFSSREDYLAFGEKIRLIHEAGGGHLEWRLQTLDGPRDYWVSVSPLPGGERFFVLSDITDQKAAEALTRSLNRVLESRVAERTAMLETANEALRQSEETFRTLFENAGSAIVFVRDREIRMANPACASLLGYSPEEMAGMNTLKFHISREKYEEFARVVYPEIQRAGHWSGEWPFRRRDGEILWFECRMTEREPGELLCIGHDVTARKEAETALQESESRFRWLIETHRLPLWTTDTSGQTTFLSPSWRNFTGHDPARPAGDEWRRFIHPDDVLPVIHRWNSALSGESSRLEMEFRLRRADGAYRWMNAQATPVRDGHNQIRHWMAVAWDVHENREAQERLRRSEERYRRLVNLIPYGIQELDTDGRIHFANPALARIFQMELDEIVSKTIFDLDIPEPERLRAYFRRLCEERPPKEPYFGDFRTPSGEWRHQQVDWDYVVNDADELEGFVAVISDITQRKRDEDAVREAKESAERHALRAEAANRSKSLFLANMSHEIRTPMNAILGYCQILQRDAALPPHCRKQVDIMQRSGEHLLALLNDILDMSKIEAGRAVLRPQPTDLIRMLADVAGMFRPMAEEKGLDFRLDQAGLTIRRVEADRSKLRQVLINLLGNAFKFTGQGSVTLALESEPLESGRVRLSGVISDTGRGIPPGELETLFEPFKQGRTYLEEPAGTGLGLAISREFVRLMGGDLMAENQRGGGAVFRFHVQADPVETDWETPESPAGIDPAARLFLPPGTPPPRLLVAEDRKTNRDILVQLLKGVGAEVHVAADGKEAVAAWERLRPELIFMDLRMPVMDGLEAARRILDMAPSGAAPVIVAVTASAFETDRSAVFEAGCRDMLPKPFRLEDILCILRDTAGWRLETPAETPNSAREPRPSADLDRLPPEARAELLSAVSRANIQAIGGLIDRLEAEFPAFAAAARARMENYDYETLANWLTKEDSK